MRFNYIATENGIVIAQGGISEVAEMLGTAIATLKEHVKSGKPLVRSNIYITREERPKKERKKQQPKKNENVDEPPKFEDYAIFHLKHDGNTTSNTNPKEYLSILKENGLNCKFTKIKDGRDEHYLIEVIYD